jgi:26S proteasome regulatory subunit N3
LERAVETIEARFTTRVLRTLPSIRRRLTSDILAQVISDYFGPSMYMSRINLYVNNMLMDFLFKIDDAQKTELLQYLNEVSFCWMSDFL